MTTLGCGIMCRIRGACSLHSSLNRLLTMLALCLFAAGPRGLHGQVVTMRKGETATILDRFGSAAILESSGPAIATSAYKSSDMLRYRWFMVQDSSLGVVFTEPSGVKRAGLGGGDYDGDIDLLALRGVRAIEVRALLFNVWREYTMTVSATDVQLREPGATFSYNPRWNDLFGPTSEMQGSIMFVARVLNLDGSIVEAALEPVLALARKVASDVRPEALRPTPLPTRPAAKSSF